MSSKKPGASQQMNQLMFTHQFRPPPEAQAQVHRFMQKAEAQHAQEIAAAQAPEQPALADASPAPVIP